MSKKIAVLVVFTLMLSLCGCQLAQEETVQETRIEMGDRLIGCVVTSEYLDLFDMEGYLEDNLNDVMGDGVIDGDTSAYEGRIYATRLEEEEYDEYSRQYAFEGIDGYYIFAPTITEGGSVYHTLCTNGGISEIKQAYKSVDDNIQEQRLEGTMYIAEGQGEYSFYLNPVFQDREGNVYLMAGTGLMTNSFGSCSQSTDNEVKTVVDGVETIERGSVKITFEAVPRPERIVVLQLDAVSNVLSREEYEPGALPDEIKPLADTDYFVVETHNAEGVTREIYGRDVEQMTTFAALEGHVCELVPTKILWETEE